MLNFLSNSKRFLANGTISSSIHLNACLVLMQFHVILFVCIWAGVLLGQLQQVQHLAIS